MSASRREVLAALGGAWLFASLAALPAVTWVSRRARTEADWPPVPDDDEAGRLLARCGFGARPRDRAEFPGAAAWIDAQLAFESIGDGDCERRLRRFETLHVPAGETFEFHDHVVRRELQSRILLGAVHGERQLHESATEFWRDHFSLSIAKGECAWLATSFERDALRPHALGSFRDLLRAVLLHPAMLWYLDGRLNRADTGAPNENHARELLELHTLGLGGGYTQRDVQAAARALSGWTSRGLGQQRKGSVAFEAARHDDAAKELLGGELAGGLGEQEVERIVDRVAGHPSTARFVARKLCVRYVADEPPAAVVDAVAEEFAESGGRIDSALRRLFAQAEFRASHGAKLKRPLHFVASALRACGAECDATPALLAYLDRLGHAPYQWPTPDGYPATAEHWRGGLLWRWRFAEELARGAIRGARVDATSLFARAGGRDRFAARAFGRAPSAAECAACATGDDAEALAVVLASPGFQRC
jgi:uncharacterized protein (DUF1800 family)